MRRLINIQGPYVALDAVMAVGRENLLDYQDYYCDQEHTYSALLVIFDDAKHAECEVVEQVRTLLAEKGVDPASFRVTERMLSYPDALEAEWYVEMDSKYGGPLLDLEALGARTEEQQREMDLLREKITLHVAVASELAEHNIAEFTRKISKLLGLSDQD